MRGSPTTGALAGASPPHALSGQCQPTLPASSRAIWSSGSDDRSDS